ncbi:MAG: glycosyltransferase [Silvibacterium sp.]|nr:glycosyltransferase [Silvibacterium sp.]
MRGKILIVTNYYPPFMVGGAEVVAHRQATMLRKRGWDICVFAGRAADDWSDVGKLDVEDQDGIPVYRLSHAWMDMGRNFRNQFANQILTSLLHLYKPDWVHFHNLIGLGTELTAIARRHGVKIALTLHDYWGVCYRGILLRRDWSLCDDSEMCGYACDATVRAENGFDVPIRLRRDYVAWCLSQADRIISPSRSLANDYKKLGFTKEIEPFTNGIDLAAIPARTRSPKAKVRFMCASYIGEHKGIRQLVDALRILAAKPDLKGRWHFTLVGGGYIEEVVLALAEELPSEFKFLGRVPRSRSLEELNKADAVVLASIWPENEPVTLLEALASGAAIIATDLGGNPEIVGGEEAGLLCRPRDAQALADAMEQLIRSPETIHGMSEWNQQRVKSFDEEKTVDFLESVYQAPVPDAAAAERIIICGGGNPDAMSVQLIDAFAFHREKGGVRLLWHDWAGDKAWEQADGFWWWGEDCSPDQLLPALARGMPVCVRKSPGADRLEKHLPVTIYRDERSFLAWADGLTSGPATAKADVPLLRHSTRLRPRAGFYLPC